MDMNKPLEQFTVGDWLEAKHLFSSKQFKNLNRKAQTGGIPIPSVISRSRTSISFDVDEVNTASRINDGEALDSFNKSVGAWAAKVEGQLRSSASSLFGHRASASAEMPRLSESIKAVVRKDDKYKMETRGISFLFSRHGVYLQKGAGLGYGGIIGSKWTDRYGVLKSTNPDSINKQGTGSRQDIDWFNDVLNRNMEELTDIVAEYCVEMTINVNNLLIPE